MTRRLITDTEWRRTWRSGHSRLTVEHDVDGRVVFFVDDIELTGYAASFDRTTADGIAAFIRGEQ